MKFFFVKHHLPISALFLLLTIGSLFHKSYGQAAIGWQRCLGGSGNDFSASLQNTTDGGFVVLGYTSSTDGEAVGNHGDNDLLVVRLNKNGAILWRQVFGGSGNDIGNYIQQTSDGGFIIAGYTLSTDGQVTGNHGSIDAWIVKLSGTGLIEWQRCVGGAGFDIAQSIKQTPDGGYVFVGLTSSTDGDFPAAGFGATDIFMCKMNTSGALQWAKLYGGTGPENANDVIALGDGYVLVGSTESTDGYGTGNTGQSCFILKTNLTGTALWYKHANLGLQMKEAFQIAELADGYLIGGISIRNQTQLVKINSTGTEKLKNVEFFTAGGANGNTYGGFVRNFDGKIWIAGTSVGITNISFDNMPYIIPDASRSQGNRDVWVAEVSDLGESNGCYHLKNMIWQKSFGGTLNEWAKGIALSIDGRPVILGYTESNDKDVKGFKGGSDLWLFNVVNGVNESHKEGLLGEYRCSAQSGSNVFVAVQTTSSNKDVIVQKFNSNGTVAFTRTLIGSGEDNISKIVPTADGGCVLAGRSNSVDGNFVGNNGQFDIFLVKLNSNGAVAWSRMLGGSGSEPKEIEDHDRSQPFFRTEFFTLDIKPTADGGYIVVSSTNSNKTGQVGFNHGLYDLWLAKLSSVGTMEWERCYGGSENDFGQSVFQNPDGSFIVLGETYSIDGDVSGRTKDDEFDEEPLTGHSDNWVLKVSANGGIQFTNVFYGAGKDRALTIVPSPDFTNYYFKTYVSGFSNKGIFVNERARPKYVIVKINQYGEYVSKPFINSCSGYYPDDRLYWGLSTYLRVNSNDQVEMIDPQGMYCSLFNYQNSQIGYSHYQFSKGVAVQPTPDGGYILAGYTAPSESVPFVGGDAYQPYLVKTNSQGIVEWRKCFFSGITAGQNERIYCLAHAIYSTNFGYVLIDRYSVRFIQDCPSTITLNNSTQFSSNAAYKYEGGNIISASTITQGTVSLDGTQSVLLSPGFKVTSNATTSFQAYIDGCGGNR